MSDSHGYWAADVNTGDLTFAEEMKKSDASSGDFKADYTDMCARLGVTPCPFVAFDAALSACKISNCAIDIPAWRVAMLACGLVNSPARSVVAHHCSLRRQHILDLIVMLEKRVALDAVKLDNTDWGPEAAEADSILSPLLATTAAVSYISLRYNGLGDAFIAANAGPLSQNLFLRYLNLSNNAITDEGLQQLITLVLRRSLSLQKISLKSNAIEGSGLGLLLDMTFGSVATPEEDTAFKAISKAAGDKNKQIKEINKKRKKNNESEFNEVEIPERIVKVGKTDLQLINKTVKEIDLSWGIVSAEQISAFSEQLTQRQEQSPDVLFRTITRGAESDTEPFLGFSVIS
jgi:hypothetical protein